MTLYPGVVTTNDRCLMEIFIGYDYGSKINNEYRSTNYDLRRLECLYLYFADQKSLIDIRYYTFHCHVITAL
jgi:hypothetical protein